MIIKTIFRALFNRPKMAEELPGCPACRNRNSCSFYTQEQVDTVDIAAGKFLSGPGRCTVDMDTCSTVTCLRSVFLTEGFQDQLKALDQLKELQRLKKKDGS